MVEEPATTEPSRTPKLDATPKKRRTSIRTILIAVLIGLCIGCFNIKPLWRLGWHWPIYSFGNFRKIADVNGTRREAWRWVEGRTIRIYKHPAVRADHTEEVAAGVRALLDDAGLEFMVEVRLMPEDVLAAYEASLVEKELKDAQRRKFVSLKQLQSRLIAERAGDPCAEVLIVDMQIAETEWAFAMASFSGGVVLLTAEHADRHTAKHETGHLMGYMKHDSFPIFVFGYPWEGWPWERNTLMMLLSTNEDLSPRAREALRYFWKGVEKRTGRKYLREE